MLSIDWTDAGKQRSCFPPSAVTVPVTQCARCSTDQALVRRCFLPNRHAVADRAEQKRAFAYTTLVKEFVAAFTDPIAQLASAPPATWAPIDSAAPSVATRIRQDFQKCHRAGQRRQRCYDLAIGRGDHRHQQTQVNYPSRLPTLELGIEVEPVASHSRRVASRCSTEPENRSATARTCDADGSRRVLEVRWTC